MVDYLGKILLHFMTLMNSCYLLIPLPSGMGSLFFMLWALYVPFWTVYLVHPVGWTSQINWWLWTRLWSVDSSAMVMGHLGSPFPFSFPSPKTYNSIPTGPKWKEAPMRRVRETIRGKRNGISKPIYVLGYGISSISGRLCSYFPLKNTFSLVQ